MSAMSHPISIGRIVHYTVSEHDAETINKRRKDWSERLAERRGAGLSYPADGYLAHVGNAVK
jgi:hypothetical protein